MNSNEGFGSAILELKRNQGNNEIYCDAVLYACTHSTRYDWQSEDGRHIYLYEAIQLMDNRAFFEEKIIDRLFKSNSLNLVGQLIELLILYSKDGSVKAGEALQERLNDYFIKLPNRRKSFSWHQDPRECAESIAIVLCDLYGITSFLDIAEQFGNILLRYNHRNPDFLCYDEFLEHAISKFGYENVIKELTKQSKTSLGTQCILNAILEEKKETLLHNKSREMNKISADDVIQSAANQQIRSIARIITHQATPKELQSIALAVADKMHVESDPRILANMMSFFVNVDYPYDISKLIEYLNFENEFIKSITLEALTRFEDERIHDIAIYSLENYIFIPESLALLIKNYDNDGELILHVLKAHKDLKDGYDFHTLVMSINKMFEKRNAEKEHAILLFCYHKNKCSLCRTDIVEILCENHIIPQNILEECLHDCSEDTREVAQRYINENTNMIL